MKKSFYICFLLILVFSLNFVSCGKSYNQIKRMQAMEEGVSSPTTVDELKDAISKYEDRINDIMIAEQQTGIWWKILGLRYLENGMYKDALEAYEKAVMYYPANPNLYYYVGLCAGYMAEASLDYDATGDLSKKEHYLELSESAYLRAIELNPNYTRALYGLAVLYVFELDESEKAIPLLEKLLTIETRDTDAMFVLARAYYVNYEFQLAIDLYDRIIATTSSDTIKAEAEANKKIVMEVMHDS